MPKMGNRTETNLRFTESQFSSQWYRRLPYDEEKAPSWVTSELGRGGRGEYAIRQTFESMLGTLHALPVDEARRKGVRLPRDLRAHGRSFLIDPEFGDGIYWYTIVDADAVLVSMELSMRERAVHRGYSIELVGFGSYEFDMPAYFVDGLRPRHPALIGYRWGRQSYQQVICEDHRFKSCSVSLRPCALPRYARLLGVGVPVLVDAMGMLDGSHELPELSRVLEELSGARPSATVAPAYYRAKVVEALAQLVDGCARLREGWEGLASKERDLCSLVDRLMRSNVAGDLSTRALAQAMHVGEGQLIEAFKRVHGHTPQEHVRSWRMATAARLLREDVRSVREIAGLVGYSNQGAFTDAFKARMGVTPSAYRSARLRPQSALRQRRPL